MNPCKFTIAHMRKGLNIPIPWWDLQSISFAATKAQRRFATERDAKLEATTDVGGNGEASKLRVAFHVRILIEIEWNILGDNWVQY